MYDWRFDNPYYGLEEGEHAPSDFEYDNPEWWGV